MKTKTIKFVAHPDKGKVTSLLHVPKNAKCVLVFGHGAGAGMEHANIVGIANALSEKKIGTFRYQFPFMERGGGIDSKGVAMSTVQAAVEVARKNVDTLPIFAGGHSYGGRMTSMAAAEQMLDGVAGLVFCSYPLHAPGKPSLTRAAHLPDIVVPMLFLSGTRDKMMTHELFKPTLKKLGKRVTFRWLDTADHGYKTLKRTRTKEVDVFTEIADEIDTWIRQQV